MTLKHMCVQQMPTQTPNAKLTKTLHQRNGDFKNTAVATQANYETETARLATCSKKCENARLKQNRTILTVEAL